ncbi:peptidylprolyl isomerase [Paenibacillus sp. N1-5-1-14]|uniref:peptidylprolyl isomerase n=1 Tax=Paenibacillus radicibacter TaxID=2972488 RepID=UPI00215924B8|nr:peptidylprolyl isomerase [Paenibacillus radicibacter]MCR8645864.1 peptidylprolyl isomerase [Paenibacillus radicibacter]
MQLNKHKWSKKWSLALIVVLVVVAALTGCGKKDDVVATYKDNGTVTKKEFDTFLNLNAMLNPMFKQYTEDPAFQQELLKQLVSYKVLASRADDKVKAEADKKLAEQMKAFDEMLKSQEGGKDKILKDNKLEFKDIEDFMKLSFYAASAAESKVTDEQVKAEYDKRLADDKHAFDVTNVRHILIATKDPQTQKDLRTEDEALARAKEVQTKLKANGDFDALAKEYSDDPGSKDKGGLYENVDSQMMNGFVEPFKNAAMTLAINTVSDPVKSEFGYHVMRVDSRKTSTYDELKQQIRSTLAQEQMSEFTEKEAPGLIEKNNLPKPSPSPSAKPEESPSPSPATK